jgi:hypothetical protein
MTATDTTTSWTGAPSSGGIPGPGAPRVTWRRVHAAEWLRLTGLRSTAWLTAATVGAVLGIGIVAALGVAVGALQAGPGVDPLGGVLAGVGVAEFLVAGLGVLAVTGEYASGVIRSTFTAVPGRSPVVVARAAAVAELVLGVVLAALVAGYAAVRLLLGSAGVHLSLTSDGAARALVGTVLYLGLLAVVGVALGWLVHSTAGALAVFLGVMHGLPVLGFLLPRDVAAAVVPFLPGEAGRAAMHLGPETNGLPPLGGLAVLAGYTAAALLTAVLVTRRRDA